MIIWYMTANVRKYVAVKVTTIKDEWRKDSELCI